MTATSPVLANGVGGIVAAANVGSQKPESAPASPAVASNVPGVPTLLSALAGDGEVLLLWRPPGSDGGSWVTGYDIFAGTGPNQESTTPVPGSPVTGTGVYVYGLTDGTRYYFKIKAVNAAGNSPVSNEVSATPSPVVFGLEPGSANDISQGADGSVWVIGTNPVNGGDGIYRWTGSSWAGKPGGAVTIAVGPDGSAFVINSSHQIFYWTGSGWSRGPGSATDIAVGADGSLWVIGTNPVNGGYGIYRWTGSRWAEVPGGAVTIAVDPNGDPLVINSVHQIFSWTDSSWSQIPGNATDIAAGADGSLWIIGTTPVNGGYGIYRWTGSTWAQAPGGAVTISAGPVGLPWVTNAAHHIYAG